MANLTALVTGGAGYIGSHSCKALRRAGYHPVVLDNLQHGHERAVKWAPWRRGDILDKTRLDEVFATYSPEAVIHFAAYAYVGEFVTDPGKYYRNHFVGTLTLLEVMRDHGVDKIVFSSSCATYGNPDVLPIREKTPQSPINPYAASKAMAERVLADFGTAHGLKATVLRYFNAAGADPDNEIGELHDPETHLIPLLLDAASGGRMNVTVFGTDYPTDDGTCVRDYIHVSDLAEAHVKALRRLLDGGRSSIYNLGNGRGFSVKEVIDAVERVTGLTVPVVFGDRRPGDPAALISDASKARDELGWRPQFAGIDEIVRTAWAWHRNATHN